MRNGDDKQELLADLIIQYVRPYFLLLLQTMPSLSLSLPRSAWILGRIASPASQPPSASPRQTEEEEEKRCELAFNE